MGMFEVKVELANLAAPGRAEEVSLLVDTGATLSWIPREVLQKLGVTAFSKLPFSLADGRVLERDTTAVILTIDGDRKSTRLNSSHSQISYAVFCLKKKKKNEHFNPQPI